MTTYYKGKIGFEDVRFGNDTFLRYNKNLGTNEYNEINSSHIPRKTPIAKTANFTITSGEDSGEVLYTNSGATGTITITLPASKAGMVINFLVLAAQEFRLDPSGSELFRDCAAGKYKGSNVVGNSLHAWCGIDGTWEWDYNLVSGNWNNEA